MSRHMPKPTNNNPHHEGRGLRALSRDRSCQTTKAEKRGTKKPWEKFGSLHCPTRWTSVGKYSQSKSPAITAICHHGGDPGLGRSARAVGGADCSTWLRGTGSVAESGESDPAYANREESAIEDPNAGELDEASGTG